MGMLLLWVGLCLEFNFDKSHASLRLIHLLDNCFEERIIKKIALARPIKLFAILLTNFLPQIVARLGYRCLEKFSFNNNILFIWSIALFRLIVVHYCHHTELCRIMSRDCNVRFNKLHVQSRVRGKNFVNRRANCLNIIQ